MVFQIVKITDIPIFDTRFDRARGADSHGHGSAEVWQPVGQTHATSEDAIEALERHLQFNKGNGLFYMVVETHGSPKKA